jgi:predicted Zn-dependent protease
MKIYRFFFILALLATLPSLISCSTNPATGKKSFTAFMSREDELRIGTEEHPKLIKEYGGIYKDYKLQAYIKRIGLNLTNHADTSKLTYTFTILNSEEVNALALPGGYVYITRGLLALVENEAEMAGVLAHEIGHITARHTAERYSKAQATNLGMMMLNVLSSTMSLPTGVNQLVGFGAQAALKSYSREQELESDMLGVRYLIRAGYSPSAMTSFFRKLKAHEKLELTMKGNKDSNLNNIFSTHPRTVERISKAVELANASHIANPVLGRKKFLTEVDGIVFGDDPNQGVRRGREFIHRDLGIRFEVPPGFILFNSETRVIARGPHESLIVFELARGKMGRKSPSLENYMVSSWARRLSLKKIEHININGLKAVTASSRFRGKDYRLIAIRGEQKVIFHFTFITTRSKTTQFSSDFRRATYSFRQISEAEGKAIRPLRIKIIKIAPDDTLKKLANRMPFEAFRLERLCILNGLTLDQKLMPGRSIKMVVK